jgi:hypothetical protein
METLSEPELRSLLARILCNESEAADEELMAADPELSHEVERRLEACGARLHRGHGTTPLCVIETEGDELSEIARAALALCAIALRPRSGEAARPRITVDDLRRRIDASQSGAYIRRAALGPLEKRGLVHVVKPEQRAEDAYVVAGPALSAIDAESLLGRLQMVGSSR